jgi:Tfp pilus assembly protein PilW
MNASHKTRKKAVRGQTMVEYAALLAMFVLVAVTLVFLLDAFNSYGWRIINLVGLDYP